MKIPIGYKSQIDNRNIAYFEYKVGCRVRLRYEDARIIFKEYFDVMTLSKEN